MKYKMLKFYYIDIARIKMEKAIKIKKVILYYFLN